MRQFDPSSIDPSLIDNARVAVIGYGAQGRAQALNLRDSGVTVCVGLRPGSGSVAKVEADGLEAADLDQAVASADYIAFLLPDETHGALYREVIANNAQPQAALVFAHGFSVHYGLIKPRADLDTVLVAPKGVGREVRGTYLRGAGVAALVAVHQDASGQALGKSLAYAGALGCGRTGILETDFRSETETDLFGEQVVLCGGASQLVLGAFETLVDAGYAPELAYFECLHELKLIADMLQARGLAGMSEAISNTAEFGAITRGPRVIDDGARQRMQDILGDIQSGAFAREFEQEMGSGGARLHAFREQMKAHEIEKVGSRLRKMMPWLADEEDPSEAD